MSEIALLKAIMTNWSKEKITNFINIMESDYAKEKLTGLQRILLPSIKDDITLISLKKLIIESSLIHCGKKKTITEIENTLLKSKSNNIWYTVAGTIKRELSLIKTLPDSFLQVHLNLFTQNCKNCNMKTQKKYICLICGNIVCNDNCCPNELYIHNYACNETTGLFLQLFYGNLCIVFADGILNINESFYKNQSQRYITSIAMLERILDSRDLEAYKFNSEEYKKWNNLYITDGLFLEFIRNVSKQINS